MHPDEARVSAGILFVIGGIGARDHVPDQEYFGTRLDRMNSSSLDHDDGIRPVHRSDADGPSTGRRCAYSLLPVATAEIAQPA